MKREPVTHSKGGWRRKPRIITPFVIANYWPKRRGIVLRRDWPTLLPYWEILVRLNRIPGPREVTHWHCRAMAAHLGLKRPSGTRELTKKTARLEPAFAAATIRIKERRRKSTAEPVVLAQEMRPEPMSKLRKVGRRIETKKGRQERARTHSVGMSRGHSKTTRMLRNAMDPEDDRYQREKRIRRLYQRGWTGKELMARFGVSQTAVYLICQGARQGLPFGKSKRGMGHIKRRSRAMKKLYASAPSRLARARRKSRQRKPRRGIVGRPRRDDP